MKTTANRLIVLTAGVIALGTTAFGQNRMTAEIPFAFRTASGTLPAGNYEFNRAPSSIVGHSIIVTNTSTGKSVFAGNSLFNAYRQADVAPIVEFACASSGCALKAIRTRDGAAEYSVPKSKDHETVAVISVPLKPLSAD